jgi:hypothetical protein
MVAELEDAAPGDAATFTAEGSPGEGDEELGVRAWHRDDDHEREAADEAPATIRTEFGIPEFLPRSR